jgi:hypothetical protein
MVEHVATDEPSAAQAKPPRLTRIYVLKDPRDGAIRYVGKTVVSLRLRLWNHTNNALARNLKTHVSAWIRQLHGLGLAPVIELIETVQHDESWASREQHWIASNRAAGADLTNLTIGGEGTPGKIVGAEWRAKMSALMMGRVMDNHTRALMSEAKRNLSPEARAAMGAAQAKRFTDPEARAKLGNQNRNPSAETRAKIGAAGRNRPAASNARIAASNRTRIITDETRARISAVQMGHPTSAETREKIAAAQRGRILPPEQIAKMKAAALRITPETRKRMGAAQIGKKLTPEHCAKIAAAGMGRRASDETRALLSAARRRTVEAKKTAAALLHPE